jgi:Zn finger protein HypA/HybF involved in hydrogenase expression
MKSIANCQHCDTPLDTTSLPNYQFYWCGRCFETDKKLLQAADIGISSIDDRFIHQYGFTAWNDTIANLIVRVPKFNVCPQCREQHP